jgi:hypothetical protein
MHQAVGVAVAEDTVLIADCGVAELAAVLN